MIEKFKDRVLVVICILWNLATQIMKASIVMAVSFAFKTSEAKWCLLSNWGPSGTEQICRTSCEHEPLESKKNSKQDEFQPTLDIPTYENPSTFRNLKHKKSKGERSPNSIYTGP